MLEFQLSASPVDENTTFSIDLTGSSDADGTIVRATVRQRPEDAKFFNLEPRSITQDSAGVFEFTAPEVFGQVPMILRMEIEDDDGAITTGSAYFDVVNVPSDPKIDGVKEFVTYEVGRPFTLLGPADVFNEMLLVIDEADSAASGEDQMLILEGGQGGIDDYASVGPSEVASPVPKVDALFRGVFTFNLEPGSRNEFAIASTDADKLYWFVDYEPALPYSYINDVTIDVPSPCYVTGRTNSGQDVALIGQRDEGMSVVRIDPIRPLGANHEGFTYDIVSTTGAGRSLCLLFPTKLNTTIPGEPPLSQLDDLIAIDFDTNELVLLADYVAPAEEYEIVDTIAIDTGGASGLRIVDVKTTGTPGEVPRMIWILMTDGIANGQHRLVVISQDYRENISQTVHAWEGGVPETLEVLNFFGPNGYGLDISADAVIFAPSSGQIVVFEDEQIEVSDTIGDKPIYKPAAFFDIGSGAGSAIIVPLPLVAEPNAPHAGLLVSYPEQGVLRLFADMD